MKIYNFVHGSWLIWQKPVRLLPLSKFIISAGIYWRWYEHDCILFRSTLLFFYNFSAINIWGTHRKSTTVVNTCKKQIPFVFSFTINYLVLIRTSWEVQACKYLFRMISCTPSRTLGDYYKITSGSIKCAPYQWCSLIQRANNYKNIPRYYCEPYCKKLLRLYSVRRTHTCVSDYMAVGNDKASPVWTTKLLPDFCLWPPSRKPER